MAPIYEPSYVGRVLPEPRAPEAGRRRALVEFEALLSDLQAHPGVWAQVTCHRWSGRVPDARRRAARLGFTGIEFHGQYEAEPGSGGAYVIYARYYDPLAALHA